MTFCWVATCLLTVTHTFSGTQVTRFGLDGTDVWADLNGSNALVSRYVRPEGEDALGARVLLSHVLLREGRPVPLANLNVQQVRGLRDQPWMGGVYSAEGGTDSEGRFSFPLSPSEYQLSVQGCEEAKKNECLKRLPSVFYPGARTDVNEAGRIRLLAGDRKDLQLQRGCCRRLLYDLTVKCQIQPFSSTSI